MTRLLPFYVCLCLTSALTIPLLPQTLQAQSTSAQSQALTWVQIEAQPTLAEAQERARAWGQAFEEVAGFRMNSGWYAIVLGPYSAADASARLSELRRENLIPSDSFIATNSALRLPFWPQDRDPRNQALRQPFGASPAVIEVVTTEPAPSLPAPSLAPPPTASADRAAMEAETPAAAKAYEANLSVGERQDIQKALQWFGHYNSSIDGSFGPGSRAAISAWQESQGLPPSGVLGATQHPYLLSEKDRLERVLGLQSITDEEAGISLLLPSALVQFERYEPPFAHYSEKAGSGLKLSLISRPGGPAALDTLYGQLQALRDVPTEGARQLTAGGFTIEGQSPTQGAEAVVRLEQGMIKGYLLRWDNSRPDVAAQVASLRPLIAGSLRSSSKRSLDPSMVPLDAQTRSGLLAGLELRAAKTTRSGIYVSDRGDVLTTSAAVDGCRKITLPNGVEAKLKGKNAQIALLQPLTPLAPSHVARFSPNEGQLGEELTVAGYAWGAALPAAALSRATLMATEGLGGERELARLALAPLPADAGGPVLDGRGAVLGMMAETTPIAGRQLPEGVSFYVKSSALAQSLGREQSLQPHTGGERLSPDALTRHASAITVLVSCWE